MIKHLLLLITFSQQPYGIEIKHVETFDQAHECTTHSEIHNYLAKRPERATGLHQGENLGDHNEPTYKTCANLGRGPKPDFRRHTQNQIIKLMAQIGKLADDINKQADPTERIGGCLVALTILAAQHNTTRMTAWLTHTIRSKTAKASYWTAYLSTTPTRNILAHSHYSQTGTREHNHDNHNLRLPKR